jgi:hypothetical protein
MAAGGCLHALHAAEISYARGMGCVRSMSTTRQVLVAEAS